MNKWGNLLKIKILMKTEQPAVTILRNVNIHQLISLGISNGT